MTASAMTDLLEIMSALSSLRQLTVSCKTLRRLPRSFNNLMHLQQLHLKGCDALSSLPAWHEQLAQVAAAEADPLPNACNLA